MRFPVDRYEEDWYLADTFGTNRGAYYHSHTSFSGGFNPNLIGRVLRMVSELIFNKFIPSFGVFISYMSTCIFTHLKVLYSIVSRIFVDVMDYLGRFEIATKMFLHNQSVFSNISLFSRVRMVVFFNIPILAPFNSSTPPVSRIIFSIIRPFFNLATLIRTKVVGASFIIRDCFENILTTYFTLNKDSKMEFCVRHSLYILPYLRRV